MSRKTGGSALGDGGGGRRPPPAMAIKKASTAAQIAAATAARVNPSASAEEDAKLRKSRREYDRPWLSGSVVHPYKTTPGARRKEFPATTGLERTSAAEQVLSAMASRSGVDSGSGSGGGGGGSDAGAVPGSPSRRNQQHIHLTLQQEGSKSPGKATSGKKVWR